jgi:hypothetical protein
MVTITAHQFDHLRDMVLRESAIVLEPGKEYLVESRLAPIARREGLGSVSELAQRLITAPSAKLKNEIIERWSPHLTLLGDFHTHPYANLQAVMSARDGDGPKGGFHFSAADRESFHGDDFLWEVSGDTPVNIVMTICRMGKVKESYGATSVKNHIWQYDVGEFRFWLTINIGYIDEDEERYLTVETDDEVYLELDSRFYNYAGDRVAGHIGRD